jgi:hypothetical protein
MGSSLEVVGFGDWAETYFMDVAGHQPIPSSGETCPALAGGAAPGHPA